MASTIWIGIILLLLTLLQQSHATYGGILVKSISTALLVVGLITLLLGGSAVIIGIIVFKVIVKRYKRKSEFPDEHELQDAPTGHMYEQVDSATRRTEEPLPYEEVVSEKERPPINVPSQPEEIGFTVTASVEDVQDGYEEYDPDLTSAEQELVTPNPHYMPVDENRNCATPAYSIHDTHSKSPRGEMQLESAINFYDRDEIEGELIDEVDYQNVTVVRTRVRNEQESRVSPQEDIFQRGMATTTVEWQNNRNGGNSVNPQGTEAGKMYTEFQQKEELPESTDEFYDDVAKLGSTGLYQNFGPGQDHGVRVESVDSLDEDHPTQDAQAEDEYGEFNGAEELYINTPSLHNRAIENEPEFNYQNMSPNQFRT